MWKKTFPSIKQKKIPNFIIRNILRKIQNNEFQFNKIFCGL